MSLPSQTLLQQFQEFLVRENEGIISNLDCGIDPGSVKREIETNFTIHLMENCGHPKRFTQDEDNIIRRFIWNDDLTSIVDKLIEKYYSEHENQWINEQQEGAGFD